MTKFLIPLLLCPLLSLADVRIGDEIRTVAIVCVHKESAVAIVEAHAAKGAAAAADVYNDAEDCNRVRLAFRVGKEARAITVEEGKTVRIVEIHDLEDDSLVLYWLTMDRVLPKAGERRE